jgi:hypothetical protein
MDDEAGIAAAVQNSGGALPPRRRRGLFLFGQSLSFEEQPEGNDKVMEDNGDHDASDDDNGMMIPSPPRSVRSSRDDASPFSSQDSAEKCSGGRGRRTMMSTPATMGFPATSLFSSNNNGNHQPRLSTPHPFSGGNKDKPPATPLSSLDIVAHHHRRKRTSDDRSYGTMEEDDADEFIDNDDDICPKTTTTTTTTSSNSSASSTASASGHGRNSKTNHANNHTKNLNGSHHHLSPNIIMAMDGRILHSKNPFSSPVVMESSSSQHYMTADTSAPSIPGMYNVYHHHHNNNNNNDHTGDDATKLRRVNASTDVGAAKLDHHHHHPHRVNLQMKPSSLSSSQQRQLQHQHQPPQPPKTPMKKKKPMKSSPTWLQPKKNHNHSHHTNTNNTASSSSRFANDFDVIQRLGQGCFGTVYSVMSRLDGCLYAVKQIPYGQNVLSEIYALSALSEITTNAEPAVFHIVRYHQSWREDNAVYIQTELCSGTVAQQMMMATNASSTTSSTTTSSATTTSSSSILQPRKLLYQMLLALEFIHRHDMCHLDIKPDSYVCIISSSSSHCSHQTLSRFLHPYCSNRHFHQERPVQAGGFWSCHNARRFAQVCPRRRRPLHGDRTTPSDLYRLDQVRYLFSRHYPVRDRLSRYTTPIGR